MNVDLDIRAGEASAYVRAVYSDQLPFATSRAINWTALDFQKAQRAHMADIFTIRRKSFLNRSVKIKPFATKDSQEARVKIDSPLDRSDIFGKFETDTQKVSVRGGLVAVPTRHVPRTGAGVVKKGWRPRALRDRKFRDGFRTFIRPSRSGFTIFFDERAHGGKVVPLYQLVPRVKIEPELHFVRNAGTTIRDRWAVNFTRSFDSAAMGAR